MLEARQTTVQGGPHVLPTIIVNSVFLAVAWIAVLLRIYTRLMFVKATYCEDWLMVVAVMFFSVYCVSVIETTTVIASKNTDELPLSNTLEALKLLLVSETFYILTVLILKVSVGLFFLRIAVDIWHRRLIYFAICLSTTYNVAFVFFTIFQCGLFHNMLQFLERRLEGQCASPHAILGVSYTHAAITTLTDWIFVLIPILLLRGSSMTTKEKLIVGFLMIFASVSGIASIIRFFFIPGLAVSASSFFPNAAKIAIWSCIEPGIGITAGSIICLRPLFRHHGLSLSRHFSDASEDQSHDAQNQSPDLSHSNSEAYLCPSADARVRVETKDESWPFSTPREKEIAAVHDRGQPQGEKGHRESGSDGFPLELFASRENSTFTGSMV